MNIVLGIGLVALIGYVGYSMYGRLRPRERGRFLRWGVGGAAALLAAGFALLRRFDLAAFAGFAAYSIIARGRIGPFSLGGGDTLNEGNVSKVQSRYLVMELDHDTGAVTGQVLAGTFAGWDLMDLGELDTRALIDEIAHDADSVALLESWLDANRDGWREYFAGAEATGAGDATASGDPEAEAYAVLGLEPGAGEEAVRAAHRDLMKGVHPDHGGSSFLAAKINEARDLLLARLKANGRG